MAKYFEVIRNGGHPKKSESLSLGLVEAESIEAALARVKTAGLPANWAAFSRGEAPAYFSVSALKGGYASPEEANRYNAEYNRARQAAHARNFPGLIPDFRPRPTDLRVLRDEQLTALATL